MDDYKKVLKLCDLNGNADAKKQTKFKSSGTKWMNTRVIGSKHLPILMKRARYTGGFHNATKIPKKGEAQYSGPSITNPNTTVILRDQRNTLGNFLGQTGEAKYKHITEMGIHPLYRFYILYRRIYTLLSRVYIFHYILK